MSPGLHLFVIGDEVTTWASDDRMCFFELDTEAGRMYELRSSGSVPKEAAAFAYELDADVVVDGEVSTTVRIPMECLRTSLSCNSDDDCVAVGVDREFVCAKPRPDRIIGVCELKGGPWIPPTDYQRPD